MKTKFWTGIICCVFVFSSCGMNKNMVCFKDLHLPGNAVAQIPPDTLSNYRLRPHDILYVSVLTLNPEVNQLFSPTPGGGALSAGTQQMYGDQVSQYLNGYEVTSDGKITVPLMGTMPVGGLLLADAQDTVSKRADKYLKDANVKVKLLSFKVTVMGEVVSPGVYYNYRDNLTVLEAISMARGLTDYALLKHVLVIRQTPKGKLSYYLDLSGKSVLESKGYNLQPNDVVYVEPEKFKRARINSSLYSVMLSGISTLIVVITYLAK